MKFVLSTLIHWIALYPLNNWGQIYLYMESGYWHMTSHSALMASNGVGLAFQSGHRDQVALGSIHPGFFPFSRFLIILTVTSKKFCRQNSDRNRNEYSRISPSLACVFIEFIQERLY